MQWDLMTADWQSFMSLGISGVLLDNERARDKSGARACARCPCCLRAVTDPCLQRRKQDFSQMLCSSACLLAHKLGPACNTLPKFSANLPNMCIEPGWTETAPTLQ